MKPLLILRSTAASAFMLAAVLLAMNYYRAAPAQHFDQTVIPVGKAPASVAIADVNHDGKPDLIIANTADETISIFLGDGIGHFTAAPGSPFACGKAPNDIAVADMNHDDNPDLIIANTETPLITVLLGDGKGGFKPSAYSPLTRILVLMCTALRWQISTGTENQT